MWLTKNNVNCSRWNPERRAQCVYHTGIPVWSIARAGISCTKETGVNRKIRQIYDGLSFSPWVCHQEGKTSWTQIWIKSPETKNIIRLTKWEGIAKRDSSKESMTDSNEIMSSVFEWLYIIEMKKFVDDGMLLQIKITLIIWQNKNTFTTRTNGSFIETSQVLTLPLRHRSDFMQALSTLQRLQQEAGEEPHVPIYTYKHKQWGGTQFIFYMVELARFMVDSLSFRKSIRRCTKYWVNGATCCLQYLARFFGKDFHEFNLFCYRLIVYSWRRSTVTDGVCKDTTQNDPFSRCKCAIIGYR